MSKLVKCKTCGAEIAKNAKVCPGCGAKNKKPFYKKWWFWVVVVIVCIALASGGSDESTDTDKKIGEVASGTEMPEPTKAVSDVNGNKENQTKVPTEAPTKAPTSTPIPVKTIYRVGDILQDGNMKITYMSSGVYVEDNEFMQPEAGKKYIYIQLAFENTSKSTDDSISSFSFECYADGYAAESYYGGEGDLSATLSPGRTTSGFLYFTVPEDAKEIEIEYETNIFTEKKIKFAYEGEKDSGYQIPANTTATEGAYVVGDVVSSKQLVITYLSCEEYVSDNMFIQPAEGYRFVSCEFEFENVSSTDQYVSCYEFYCYADGVACDATYIRDDALSATMSAGRKTKGTVTFEVPVDATVIEVEYLTNYWTSNRVVFKVK